MSIEFILDGRTVSAEPGQTILEVAKANGIEIPTLCREQRISRTTSCFVCVVKDKKTGRYIRKERYAGSCERSFYVGEDITEEDIKGEFKHGILKLFVPKKEAKPAVEQKKTIAIEG